MATEEEKKRQMIRVFEMIIEGLAKGIYDLFEDSSYAIMKTVGADLLEVMQKEMGLEIHGESPRDVLTEMMRIWVDELGFADETSITDIENGWAIEVHHRKDWNLTQKIQELGVKEVFTCPIMNSMHAALETIKVETHMHIEQIPDKKGTRFTLTTK